MWASYSQKSSNPTKISGRNISPGMVVTYTQLNSRIRYIAISSIHADDMYLLEVSEDRATPYIAEVDKDRDYYVRDERFSVTLCGGD